MFFSRLFAGTSTVPCSRKSLSFVSSCRLSLRRVSKEQQTGATPSSLVLFTFAPACEIQPAAQPAVETGSAKSDTVESAETDCTEMSRQTWKNEDKLLTFQS